MRIRCDTRCRAASGNPRALSASCMCLAVIRRRVTEPVQLERSCSCAVFPMAARGSESPKSPDLEPRPRKQPIKAPSPTSPRLAGSECAHFCACQVARKGKQLTFMTCLTRSRLFAYKRGGGSGKPGHPVTRGELSHCQPILSARAGAGKALAPSCQDTLSLSKNTKGALSWPLQHQFHMLLTAPAPLPLERRTLSSQKTNLFLFHQNVLTDLADLSWENGGWGEGNEVTRMGTIQKAT